MTAPRDFVKQDSTLTLQQRCESFLDTLAAKGATDTVFLFEELLETLPVGRTTAITILRDWQAKRASPTQCQHGQLARQCGYCERDAEIKRLRLVNKNDAVGAAMKIQTYRQRVVDEKAELDRKIVALSCMIEHVRFQRIDPIERALLREQYKAMWQYSEILSELIAGFSRAKEE